MNNAQNAKRNDLSIVGIDVLFVLPFLWFEKSAVVVVHIFNLSLVVVVIIIIFNCYQAHCHFNSLKHIRIVIPFGQFMHSFFSLRRFAMDFFFSTHFQLLYSYIFMI